MRSEQHLRADLLLDLGCVAMVEQAVRGDIAVGRAEHRAVLQCATGSADAGDAVDDDATGRDQSGRALAAPAPASRRSHGNRVWRSALRAPTCSR